jgi:mRNA-degrading endonuclease YafQ of YafQ-DinJ toxin-antitoxin module
MRTIRRTNAFKRDYKRLKKGRQLKMLDDDLIKIVALLASDARLPERHRDP